MAIIFIDCPECGEEQSFVRNPLFDNSIEDGDEDTVEEEIDFKCDCGCSIKPIIIFTLQVDIDLPKIKKSYEN